MTELKKKRERGANFSPDEVSTLLSIISDHKEIIECKKSDGTTWRKKEAAWDIVADSFNSCCANPRSKKALRKKYEDIKKNIRKKHKQIKMEQLKTGGGIPDSKAFTIMEKAVIAIAGCTRDGNTSVWDSDSILKSTIIKEKPTNEANDESETMETDNQESVENFEDVEYLTSDVDKAILENDKVNSTEDIVHKGISALKRLIEPNIRPMKKTKVVPNNEQEYLCETEREKELHNMQMSIFRQEMEINRTRLQAAQLDIEIKLMQKQVEEARLQKLL